MEIKGRNWSPRGTRRRGFKSFTSRLAVRVLAVVAVIGTYHCLDLHIQYRNSMRAKYSATQFTALSDYDQATLSSHGWEVDSGSPNPDRAALLDNRKHWKRLGGGREGDVFTYNDTVIKVYNEQTSPFRNCMPGSAGRGPRRWPTEIPASLVMGGHEGISTPPNQGAYKDMFVPVKDYFLAASDPSQAPKWHLVTPFLKSGTLKTLAKKLRTSETPLTYREVDVMFRPSFEALLDALHDLHRSHDLCHDDVKMDNVFVASGDDPRAWKIGDLGNAREPGHAYHASRLWIADTPQLRDCRANDALRLARSYLSFVRLAAGDPQRFDAAFYDGVEPLSRFYWAAAGAGAASLASAADVKGLSEAYPPMRDGDEMVWDAVEPAEVDASGTTTALVTTLFGWNPLLRNTITMELRVGAKEDLGQLFGLTNIFGVPVTACPVV